MTNKNKAKQRMAQILFENDAFNMLTSKLFNDLINKNYSQAIYQKQSVLREFAKQ
jgi:hypothetical protein